MYAECPKCGGEIEYGDYYYEDSIWQLAECKKCGFQWQNVYEFSHSETRNSIHLDEFGNESPD